MAEHHVARIPLLLLGCGGVGRELLARISAARDAHAAMGVHISVIAVCDSETLAVPQYTVQSEIDDAAIAAIIAHKAADQPLRTFQEGSVLVRPRPPAAQIAEMARAGVLADCTAACTDGLLEAAVRAGACVALANKKPLTATLESFDTIVSAGRRYRNESTVGAGLPLFASLARLRAANDPVRRIAGALSGTLGFVITELQLGRPLSEAVLAAKSLGYTEPDPRDDLSGVDVARKALILARTIGWRLNMADVEVESLFPVSMGPDRMNVTEFLHEALPQLDDSMRSRVQSAATEGKVLRYAAVLEEGRCRVGLVAVSADSALGRLQGCDNVVEISSACYSTSPLVLQGAGAGQGPTAAGVLADVLDMRDLFGGPGS